MKIRQIQQKILEYRTEITKIKEEIFNKKNNIKFINLSDLYVKLRHFFSSFNKRKRQKYTKTKHLK